MTQTNPTQPICHLYSAPPTSPDCMVVGFSPSDNLVSIHYVAREPTWRTIRVGGEVSSIHVPTFIGEDLYALDDDGTLIGFTELGKEDYSSMFVEARAPISHCTSPPQYYLMKCTKSHCGLTLQLHESAGGLSSLKLSLHSCSLPGSTNAMGIETSIALVLPAREHECDTSLVLGRPPALS
ncbi:hypothetical protein Tco_0163929 [Tanacetum coccineum]